MVGCRLVSEGREQRKTASAGILGIAPDADSGSRFMIKIDKKSLKLAIRDSKFPKDYPIEEIERDLENDIRECLSRRDVKNGLFSIKSGKIKFDIEIDKSGKQTIKRKYK